MNDDELQPAPFDERALLERCMNNMKVVEVLFRRFEADMPALLETLRRQCNDGDVSGAAATAHSLKGAAAAMAANRLRDFTLQVETALRNSDSDVVRVNLVSLDEELRRCIRHIPSALTTLRGLS